MNAAPLYVVDIIGEVVAATNAIVSPKIGKQILYTYGRSIQVLSKLIELNNAISTVEKNSKYPLFALFMDFPESHNTAYSFTVTFPKIAIATITNSTDDAPKRYGLTFKPILYPIYDEFMRQLVRHKNIVAVPDSIPHIKWDRPGTAPEGKAFTDFVDAIEIQNLQLTFKTVKICKPS